MGREREDRIRREMLLIKICIKHLKSLSPAEELIAGLIMTPPSPCGRVLSFVWSRIADMCVWSWMAHDAVMMFVIRGHLEWNPPVLWCARANNEPHLEQILLRWYAKVWDKGSHHLKKKEFYEKLSQNGDNPLRLVFVKSLFRLFSPIFKGKFVLVISVLFKGLLPCETMGTFGTFRYLSYLGHF